MSAATPRWGRAEGHRVQHAWERSDVYPEAVALCWGAVARRVADVAFDSDAARCERCAAVMKRREAQA